MCDHLNIAEFFKFMIKHELYVEGDFMCWEICEAHWMVDDQPEKLNVTLPSQDAVETAIRDFMSQLINEYGVVIDEDDDTLSLSMMYLLNTIKIMKAEAGVAHPLAVDGFKVAFKIYSDWDNRFNIVKEMINGI